MNDNKDVVFVIDDAYSDGGIARVTLSLIAALEKYNYNVTLISLSKKIKKEKYYIPKYCKVIDLDIKYFRIRRDTLRACRMMKKIFDKNFEGTFVIDDVGHNIPAWLGLRHCRKAKFISWSHMNFFNGSRWGFSGWGKRLAVKKFDYLVALTKEDKGYYDKILKGKNVVQIYNPKNKNVIRGKYNAESRKIISCGRLNPIKGFDLLIEVAKKVFSNPISEGWSWDIYGEGTEKENLWKKIQEYGLVGKVNLMGYSSHILEKYQDYSFYVFTSRGEGCPMVMIEALSAGLPMISFDFKCGPKDMITNGENGYIIEDWNLNDMENKILELMQDKDKRVTFAANADMNLGEMELDYVLNKWNEIL